MSHHLPVVSGDPEPGAMNRRDFVKMVSAAAGAILAGCDVATREAFLQKHFRELGPDERAAMLRRLEREYADKYGKQVTVGAEPAQPGVLFGYALDLSRCIGCRRCVYACVKENNQSRDPQIQWIRVLSM